LPLVEDWGPCRAIGIAENGELIAAIVFNNYHWPNIECSIASSSGHWCSRRNLAAIFAYPFRQLACRRVGATTEATNQPVRQFLLRLGFCHEGLMRCAFPPTPGNPEGHAAVFGMLEAECAWLRSPRDGGHSEVIRRRGIIEHTAAGRG
jgi:RimJ/RimL family protein N-acetyltransferase